MLDAKTKELIALALSVAARCDPCIGFHAKSLVKLGATRQEIDGTLGVTTYMGGGPSLMYAANAVAAFDEGDRRKDSLAWAGGFCAVAGWHCGCPRRSCRPFGPRARDG